MNDDDREHDTSVTCPKCEGEGFVVIESSATAHRGKVCDVCAGARVVTAAQLIAYRNAIG